MRIPRPLYPLLAFAASLGTISCGPDTRVATAREFIENYSEAMLRKSARRVLAMEADGPLMLRFARNAAQRDKLARYDRDQRRGELERLFQKEDLWWKAWCMTRYENERIHDDHLDVGVSVAGARSQVVLVRADDGTLRLHPLPGWVHAAPAQPGTGASAETTEETTMDPWAEEDAGEEPALEE